METIFLSIGLPVDCRHLNGADVLAFSALLSLAMPELKGLNTLSNGQPEKIGVRVTGLEG